MMGRRLSFRAWDGTKMIAVSAIEFLEDTAIINGSLSVPITDVMQSTGMEDKNGTEIFESDILYHAENYEPYHCVMQWSDKIGSCGCCYEAFDGAGFVGKILPNTKYNYSSLAAYFDEMEIVGNTYENPEFLKRVGKVT